jgi:hypothetical protein
MPVDGHGLVDTNILILRRQLNAEELPPFMSISAITLAELSARSVRSAPRSSPPAAKPAAASPTS